MTIRRGSGERKRTGSSITEFGPAIGLLLLFFFLPLVDMLSMCVAYGCCMLLNNMQVHEASLIPWADAENADGPVRKNIPIQWKTSGFGQYVKVVGDVQSVVDYRHGESVSDGVTDKIVSVKTTVTCSPFLPIPLPIVNAPGLNGPMTFTIFSERPMENPDYGKP
jgi:hypothetical protein